MSQDRRLWAKVDLGYLSNLKMSEVLDESPTAPLMHLASILHCAQHLTDGHASPKAMQRVVGGSPSDIELLVEAGLWHIPGHDCSECPQPEKGRIYVHNYLDHNVSSDSVQSASERGKKAANARWNKGKDANRMQDASKAHAKRNARSDQIRSDNSPTTPDDGTEQLLIHPEPSAEASDRFEDFWKAYPRRSPHSNPKKPARQKFLEVTKKVDPQVLIDSVKAYAQTRQDEDPRFTVQAIKWLRDERWDDDYTEQPQGDSSWDKLMNWNKPN